MTSLREGLRQMDSEIDEMVQAVEAATTLALLMLAGWRLARTLAVKLVEEVLSERAQVPIAWSKCGKCGAKLESKGMLPRQIIGLIGIINWKRRVGRCPHGCTGEQVVPLDIELGLRPNQRVSAELQRLACALAVFVPFETASVLLAMLTGVVIDSGTIWNWVQQAGQLAMAKLEQELEAFANGNLPEGEVLPDEIAALPLIIGADGVMVPFRPEPGTPEGKTRWREVKVGLLARLQSYFTKDGAPATRLVQRRVVAVLGTIDDFAPRLRLEALRQGIATARLVVWLSDGGRGFWRLFKTHFANQAIGVLDFYHAAQNLGKGAWAWLDGRTQRARQWFDNQRHRLRHGQAQHVLADIQAALALDGLPPSARQALQNLYNYLDTHRKHIDYARFKALGLPIGSGMIESTCKWLIQQRFKGVGMRWSDEGFNHLLHLRLAWVNGRFDGLFLVAALPPII